MRYAEIREALLRARRATELELTVAHKKEAHLAARGFRLEIHLAPWVTFRSV